MEYIVLNYAHPFVQTGTRKEATEAGQDLRRNERKKWTGELEIQCHRVAADQPHQRNEIRTEAFYRGEGALTGTVQGLQGARGG